MGLSVLDDKPEVVAKEMMKLLIKQGLTPEALKKWVDIAAEEVEKK